MSRLRQLATDDGDDNSEDAGIQTKHGDSDSLPDLYAQTHPPRLPTYSEECVGHKHHDNVSFNKDSVNKFVSGYRVSFRVPGTNRQPCIYASPAR